MLTYLKRKYWKPGSLTWLMSVAPLVAGLVIATEPLHGMSGLVEAINNMTGSTPPAVLINAGLAGIGIRGAIG